MATAMQRHPVLVGDRLARQEGSETVYLVAWEDGCPVGQALLHWRRPRAERVAEELRELPYLEDVYVPHDMRNRGAGTQLLEAAVETVRRSGGDRLTLAVNVDNTGARRLYGRAGFVEAGVPVHPQTFWHYNPDSVLHSHDENVIEMVCHLAASETQAEGVETSTAG